MVEEFEQITNEKQREMAYEARRALKHDLVCQAENVVADFLGDQFDGHQKKKVSQIVTRLYDCPKTFFKAIREAHKGSLKTPFKNIGKVGLLDASKSIAKSKASKLQLFKNFLEQKLS